MKFPSKRLNQLKKGQFMVLITTDIDKIKLGLEYTDIFPVLSHLLFFPDPFSFSISVVPNFNEF